VPALRPVADVVEGGNMTAGDDNVIPFPKGGRAGRPKRATSPSSAGELADDLTAWAGGPREALGILLQLGTAFNAEHLPTRRSPELLPPRAERATYTVRIDLTGARPPIWRRIELASDPTLDRVHDVVQRAMGWTDSHLHHFQTTPFSDMTVLPFLTPFDEEDEPGIEGIQEAEVRLDQVLGEVGDRLFYEYDFGDSWHHTIKLESISPRPEGAPVARCVTGRRSCPPEDCGGIGSYNELVDAIEGRVQLSPEDAEMLMGFPDSFNPAEFHIDSVNESLEHLPPDLAVVNLALAGLVRALGDAERTELEGLIEAAALDAPHSLGPDVMAGMVAHYQLLLREVGQEGVALTSAGWLPPAVVSRLCAGMGLDGRPYGKGNRENQTTEVHGLRTSAVELGLLRKYRGRLMLTTAGRRLVERPVELWWHIVGRLPLGNGLFAQQAGALRLLDLAVPGVAIMDTVATGLLAGAGWALTGAQGLDEWAAYRGSDATARVLRGMRCWGDWLSPPTGNGRIFARIVLQSTWQRQRGGTA